MITQSTTDAIDELKRLLTQTWSMDTQLAARPYSDRIAAMRVRLLSLQGRLLERWLNLQEGRRAPRAQRPLTEVAKDVLTRAEKLADDHQLVTAPPSAPLPKSPARNGPCTCGSGRKWKKCCGGPEQANPVAA